MILNQKRTMKKLLHSLFVFVIVFYAQINTAQVNTAKFPLLNSVQMVKKMIRFVPLQAALSTVENSILKGNILSPSLKENPLLDKRISI
jgi:type IV pilus assembly protein PilC